MSQSSMLITAALFASWPVCAHASPPMPSAFEADPVRSQAFPTAPVSNATLAASYGAADSRMRNRRLIADNSTIPYLQQVGRTAGVAIDWWWGETGAALIASNIVTSR